MSGNVGNEPDALSKMTRINALFDFYETLLTDKQRTILAYYYHDDFSLGEIATEFGISRQAVYDNVKRAEQALEAYESRLGLLDKHEQRLRLTEQLERDIHAIEIEETNKRAIMRAIERFRAIDER